MLVWTARLDGPADPLRRTDALLSPQERARARRYRTPRDAARFIARRGALRIGLGALLDVAPDRIAFRYTSAGKPYLWEPAFARGLSFNLAHSGPLAVFAATSGRAVGIDVERIRDTGDLLDVAAACFSPPERASLTALPAAARTAAFYRCWTRKEAYVKALGSGLRAPLQDFDVAFAEDEESALLRVRGRPEESARWHLRPLELPEGYVGALAIERPPTSGADGQEHPCEPR